MSALAALLLAATALPATLHDPRSGAETEVLPGGTTHLVFLATWCPECVEELPSLAEIRDRFESRGYRIVLVAVSARQDPARLRAFAEEHALPGPLLWDRDGSFASSLDVRSIPAHVLVGADGSEVGRWDRLEDRLEEAIRAASGEGRR